MGGFLGRKCYAFFLFSVHTAEHIPRSAEAAQSPVDKNSYKIARFAGKHSVISTAHRALARADAFPDYPPDSNPPSFTLLPQAAASSTHRYRGNMAILSSGLTSVSPYTILVPFFFFSPVPASSVFPAAAVAPGLIPASAIRIIWSISSPPAPLPCLAAFATSSSTVDGGAPGAPGAG